jgi:RimJ/RimL family protein N-acetyltransferase
MKLKLNTCTIRDWHPGDAGHLARYANNRSIWRNLRDAFPYPYTLDDARAFIRFALFSHPITHFALDVDGIAVGSIGLLVKSDIYRKTAELGYWVGEPFWGRGIATEAATALTNFAFANYDLVRVYAGVFDWNRASMRVLEKAGFSLEARLHKNALKDGHVLDELIYARTI